MKQKSTRQEFEHGSAGRTVYFMSYCRSHKTKTHAVTLDENETDKDERARRNSRWFVKLKYAVANEPQRLDILHAYLRLA
jgi:hypothetical protein